MHSPQKPYEVRFSKNFRFIIFIIQISFQNSLAASLPGLEVTGERIPTPKNWSRDECSEIIVQDPADDNLYGTHDVETPYMVESWLKGMINYVNHSSTDSSPDLAKSQNIGNIRPRSSNSAQNQLVNYFFFQIHSWIFLHKSTFNA